MQRKRVALPATFVEGSNAQKGKGMNAIVTKRALQLTALAGLLVLTGVVAADSTSTVYGRAGGLVGAERIAQVAHSTNFNSQARDIDYSKWFGNAGGPVGADAIERVARATLHVPKGVDFSQWYGRAGGPVGVQAITQQLAGRQLGLEAGAKPRAPVVVDKLKRTQRSAM